MFSKDYLVKEKKLEEQVVKLLVLDENNINKFEKLTSEISKVYEEAKRLYENYDMIVKKPFEAALKEDFIAKHGIEKSGSKGFPFTEEGLEKIVINTGVKISSKTAWKEVLEEVESYLRHAELDYMLDGSKKGVISEDNNCFISVQHILDRMPHFKEWWKKEKKPSWSFTDNKPEFDKTAMFETLQLKEAGYETLNYKNSRTYLIVKQQMDLLNEYIIQPFEKAAKAQLGFEKGKIPQETRTLGKKLGVLTLNLMTIPKTSPSYEKMVSQIKAYLSKIGEKSFDEELQKKKVVKIEDKIPYISIPFLKRNINEIQEKYKGKGYRQEFSYIPSAINWAILVKAPK